MNRILSFIGRIAKEIFSPFELLYLAIAIATLEHTAWAMAYLFEGDMPSDSEWQWRFRGYLIAIAIDVGMFLTSKFLQKSKSLEQTITLIVSFGIAALGSLYAQIVYIASHTPDYQISVGVSQEWRDVLIPLIDARVIILPLLLPLLAIVYTLARIFNAKNEAVTPNFGRAKDSTERISIHTPASAQLLLMDGEEPVDDNIDWENLTFYDPVSRLTKGPFRNRRVLISRYRALQTRRERNGIPNYAKQWVDTDEQV